MNRARSLALAGVVLAGSMACASAPPPYRPPYAAEAAPPACVQMLDAQARARCLSGDGDGCADAVRRLLPDITFADSMQTVFPAVHDARMDCIASYSARGCELGSARACVTLADALTLLGQPAAARNASLAACDRGHFDACWAASGIGRARGAPAAAPTDEQRLLAERACDLGSSRACIALGDLALFGETHSLDAFVMVDRARRRAPADVGRGLDYWEKGCLRVSRERSAPCHDLRKMLMLPHAPRRGADDWLPFLSSGGAPAGSPSGGGGICEIDPSACPKQTQVVPPTPVPPPGERARILDAHRSACARGDGRECLRLVELEVLRFDHSLLAEGRNQATPPAMDVPATTRELCARGVADACLLLTYGGLSDYGPSSAGGLPELIRACDLGAPLGCASAGHRLRAARTDPQRSSAMLARACAGGIRWACSLR